MMTNVWKDPMNEDPTPGERIADAIRCEIDFTDIFGIEVPESKLAKVFDAWYASKGKIDFLDVAESFNQLYRVTEDGHFFSDEELAERMIQLIDEATYGK